MDGPRISSLDGLRGLAASLVVYAHVKFFIPAPAEWLRLDVGNEAVALFFSLSGFLMALLYGDRPFSAGAFLIHRFARIYPIYLFAVLVEASLASTYGDAYIHHLVGVSEIARHLLMLGSTGVFWSIPPEIQFYFFFLLIWLWFARPRQFVWVPVLTVIAILVLAIFSFPGPGILLTSKLHFFVLGTLAGRLFARSSFRPDGIVVGVLTLALIVAFVLLRTLLLPDVDFWGLYSFVPAGAAAIIIYLAASNTSVLGQFLASRPLTFVGRISFSLYLLHLPVMYLVGKMIGEALPWELKIVICIASGYAVSAMTYTLLEAPARRLIVGRWNRHCAKAHRHASSSAEPFRTAQGAGIVD